MTFLQLANRLEAEQGTIVDHFHATKFGEHPGEDQRIVIFRSTSSEGYTRYITIDGWEPEPKEFDTYFWHTFHGFDHEPLWQRSLTPTKVYPVLERPDSWWVRFWKRLVSW